MKRHHWFATVLVCFAVAGVSVGRDFGPEWTRIKAPNSGKIIEYRKEIKVPVRNYGQGGGSGYILELESDTLSVVENDDNKGFFVQTPFTLLKTLKNPDGTAASHLIRFSEPARRGIQYWDLNADGILDSMHDSRGSHEKAFILLDGCFVPSFGSRGGAVTETSSPDSMIRYLFEDAKWRVKSRAFDLNEDGWPDALELFMPDQPVVHIMVDDKWISVEGNRVSDTMKQAISKSGTKYRFDKGTWRVEP